jgi:hypothetical protein
MSKSDGLENGLLKLIFQAVDYANIADDAVTAPLTNLQISLHTADPGEAGSQTTNETTYGAYARVAVSRTTTGWLVTGNIAYPQANITFATPTSGSGTITHFGIGSATSGAGVLYYSGTVTPNITISTGITPVLTTGSNITED